MNKKAKVRIIVSLAVVIGITSVGIAIATLKASTGIVNNSFKLAKVVTSIEEETNKENILADTNMKKVVCVKNTGDSNCFIRARITISPSSSNVTLYKGKWKENTDKKEVFVSEATVFDGNYFYSSDSWLYNSEDGYYYYQMVVEPGESTRSLFDAFKLSNDADITVYQEAVFALPGKYLVNQNYSLNEMITVFEEIEK